MRMLDVLGMSSSHPVIKCHVVETGFSSYNHINLNYFEEKKRYTKLCYKTYFIFSLGVKQLGKPYMRRIKVCMQIKTFNFDMDFY